MSSSDIVNLRNQVVKFWRDLSGVQQVTIGLLVLLSVGLVIALLFWARSPEYATVFSDLKEEDAAAIVTKLKEAKTPYELDNGGTSIRVPANVLYETRLQLASAGLPQGGGVGFELFNQTNFGMTDFMQKINYQRALEGELSRTINHLGPVEQSRVHIVMPQPSLYTDDQKETTASVVLTLKPGARLKDNQVRGIAQLVSSSVEGLAIENVSIVDANGNVVSDSLVSDKDPFKANSSQLESARAYEADVEQKVQGMLDKVLGQGKATVRVRALFDWGQFESSSEVYSPSNRPPQVRSSRENIERYGELPPEQGGVPGIQANIPRNAGVTAGITATSSPYEKRDVTTNYELSKTTEKTTKTAATVSKLSVAVVIDADEGPEEPQVSEISKLVSAAAGIDTARGDVLAISSIPFKKALPAGEIDTLSETQRWEQYIQMGKIAAMAIGPVLLVLFFFLSTRRSRRREQYVVSEVQGRQQPELAMPVAVAALGGAGQSSALVMTDLITDDPRDRYVKDQVTILARAKPEVMAELIRTWLNEEGRDHGDGGNR